MGRRRRTKPTKPVVENTPADDVQLVADFVRRLRRVALHPLALDDQGGEDIDPRMPAAYLRMLMQTGGSFERGPGQTVVVRHTLPDEVQFESLATRVRTFTLTGDRLYWPKALDAIDRLATSDDEELRAFSEFTRQRWTKATQRDTPNERAYVAGYHVVEDTGEGGDSGQYTDLDLAYAWLYQDVAHGDEVSTGFFDVKERFRAAVGVFSHMAVVAVETLHYINQLVALGVLELPVGTFSDPVVVTDRQYVEEVHLFLTDVGADLSVLDEQVPQNLRPALELVKMMMAKSKSEGTDG